MVFLFSETKPDEDVVEFFCVCKQLQEKSLVLLSSLIAFLIKYISYFRL